jgi:hypothetical protein
MCEKEGSHWFRSADLKMEQRNTSSVKEPKNENGQEGKKFWVHTYPAVSSRPSGRCVQSMVQKCEFV